MFLICFKNILELTPLLARLNHLVKFVDLKIALTTEKEKNRLQEMGISDFKLSLPRHEPKNGKKE